MELVAARDHRHFRIEDKLFDYWQAVLADRLRRTGKRQATHDPGAARLLRARLEIATLESHNTERLVTTNSAAQVRQPISPSAIGKADAYRDLEPFIAAYGYRG